MTRLRYLSAARCRAARYTYWIPHTNPSRWGLCGEIYVGGPGVARGYLNRDQLTARNFIPNPFGNEAKALLYRTGDRGRYKDDGTIEYVGRYDTQMKIRGFRIEPGEIESILDGHPEVKRCIVCLLRSVAVTESNRHRDSCYGQSSPLEHLVAVVVFEHGITLTRDRVVDIRSYLKDRLPAYMVPRNVVERKTLPLLPSGKVDRISLSRDLEAGEVSLGMQSDAATISEVGTAPEDSLMSLLASIWRKVLGVGGHQA